MLYLKQKIQNGSDAWVSVHGPGTHGNWGRPCVLEMGHLECDRRTPLPREQPGSPQLAGLCGGIVAAAIIDRDLVDSVGIQDNEAVVGNGNGTKVPHAVAELHPQAEGLQRDADESGS
jgi:hypothetical protein